ncbi:hypothetical protein [Helicobacter pylori]|uniref:hypothetical protein n=1 Tax=Helicobacter pylori TaxID=210 RepID=UPI0011281E69|nr:hypothetical protein [Helicobacter pylori]TPH77530.1 hypothetical protein FIM54_00925 [Helicobacter pylori]
MPYRLEKDFQDLIANNSNIQKDICSVLEMDYKDFKLLREDTYINGITADFTLFEEIKLEPL